MNVVGRRMVVALLFGVAWSARAEVPPLPKERLVEESALIVTGTVSDVRSKVVREDAGGLRETRYWLTIDVKEVEKGEWKDKGKAVVAVGKANKLPPRMVGPAGHRSNNTTDYVGDVRKGWEVRVYVTKGEEGEYAMLSPNGFEVLEKGEGKK